MRPVIYFACLLAVFGLAVWAYRENYRTQAALNNMSDIQREIAAMREELGVLRAEWAYLNRPERLRELVELNFESLQLVPIETGQFLSLDNVDFPAPQPAISHDDAPESQEQQP